MDTSRDLWDVKNIFLLCVVGIRLGSMYTVGSAAHSGNPPMTLQAPT